MRPSASCRRATRSRRSIPPPARPLQRASQDARRLAHGPPCGPGSRWLSSPSERRSGGTIREDVRRHPVIQAVPERRFRHGAVNRVRVELEPPAVSLRVAHGKALQPELAPAAPVTPARLPVSVAAEAVSGEELKHWTPTAPAPLPCTVLPSRMFTDELLLAWMPWLVALTIDAVSRTRSVEPNWTSA